METGGGALLSELSDDERERECKKWKECGGRCCPRFCRLVRSSHHPNIKLAMVLLISLTDIAFAVYAFIQGEELRGAIILFALFLAGALYGIFVAVDDRFKCSTHRGGNNARPPEHPYFDVIGDIEALKERRKGELGPRQRSAPRTTPEPFNNGDSYASACT